jgi:hypothetical protein
MRFRIDGVEYVAVEDIRVRELVEAEGALGFSMDETGSGGKMAIGLFVAMRRHDTDIGAGLLADKVMGIDLSKYEEVEEDSPPAEGSNGMDPEKQLTSGLPDLDLSVSRSTSGI